MKKPHKIKRYSQKRGFSPRPPRSPWRALLSLAVVVGLVFVGISAYKPITDFFAGRTKPSPEVESSVPAPEQTPEIVPEPVDIPPEPEPEPEVVLGSSVTGRLLPLAVAQTPEALASFLEETAAAGYNAVLFEGKTNQGEITFITANEQAATWEAVIEQPVDISVLKDSLKEKGLHLIVKMSIFSDPKAARGDLDNNAVMHSSGVVWIDNTLAAGGKPWTSPYSLPVQAYNIALARELAALGADMLVLDHARFPNDPTGTARYGGDGSQTPAEVLRTFVQELGEAAQVETALIVPYGATYADEAANHAFYGGDPLTLTTDTILLDMAGENFLDGDKIHPAVEEAFARAQTQAAYVLFLLRPEQLPPEPLEHSYIVYG